MKRFALSICLAACLVFALGSVASAVDQIVASDVATFEGVPTNVDIFLENDAVLRGIDVPLVVRAGSTYPTGITAEFVAGSRLEGFLEGVWFLNYYDTEDGTCKQGQAGGFGTIAFNGSSAASYTVPSPSDPDAFLFTRQIIIGGQLQPGSDIGGVPSLRLVVTCPSPHPNPGSDDNFFIDTTCVNPATHPLFVLNSGGGALPAWNQVEVTCQENACPENLAAASDPVAATVGSPAANSVSGVDPEGDPIEYFLVSGPGSVDASGNWSYTPTCNDYPGFTVEIEVSDKGQGSCGTISFDVDVAPTPIVPQCTDVSVHWGDLAFQRIEEDGGCAPLGYGYAVTAGPGGMGGSGNQSRDWSYQTSCSDLGTVQVTVTISDDANQAVDCDFNLTVTNTAPTCNDLPDWTAPTEVPFSLNLGPLVDADGDALTYNLVSGPAWVSINGNLLEGSRPAGQDLPEVACWNVDDGCETSADCCVNLLFESPFSVCFDDGDDGNGQDGYVHTLGGRNADICVWVDPTTGSSAGVGGFDFLICYDQSALVFISAQRGPDLHEDWEYFTFRTGMFGGNCGGACPDGFVRLVGIADMNNGIAPDPATFSLAGNVICLTFWVTSDQEYTGACPHVGFCSYDCGDNVISSKDGNTLFLPNSGATLGPDWELEECLLAKPDHFAEPFIDFCQGAICIDEPPDDRGDLNLNGIANEIGDAVLYSNYFIYGSTVWDPNPLLEAVQIFASDVNNDGLTLTIADLVYLIRIITGDEQPFPDDNINPKVAPYANAVDVVTDVRNGSLTVHTNASVALGGAVLVYRYSNLAIDEATLNAEGMVMKSRASNGELRIVVFPNAEAQGAKIPAGLNELVTIPVDGEGTIELVESQFADANGAMLSVQAAKVAPPTSYALHQNFPNPFNAGTVIPLDLKNGGDWSITVYNVAGQVVKTFNGTDEAGTINVRWDGRGDNGEVVASGMYFYRGIAEGFSATKKMVLLK